MENPEYAGQASAPMRTINEVRATNKAERLHESVMRMHHINTRLTDLIGLLAEGQSVPNAKALAEIPPAPPLSVLLDTTPAELEGMFDAAMENIDRITALLY